MAKFLNDSVLDSLLDAIAAGNAIAVCSAQPTTRTEALTTYELATTSLTSGDFTKANGDSSGRKVTVAQQSDLTVDNSGTATHIAICDSTNLLLVTTCTSQVLTAANLVTIPAFKCEVADPV